MHFRFSWKNTSGERVISLPLYSTNHGKKWCGVSTTRRRGFFFQKGFLHQPAKLQCCQSQLCCTQKPVRVQNSIEGEDSGNSVWQAKIELHSRRTWSKECPTLPSCATGTTALQIHLHQSVSNQSHKQHLILNSPCFQSQHPEYTGPSWAAWPELFPSPDFSCHIPRSKYFL